MEKAILITKVTISFFIFCNFSKVFYLVLHSLLLKKLECLWGILGEVHEWLQFYLSDFKQMVENKFVDKKHRSSFHITCWIWHPSIKFCRGLFLSIFINDYFIYKWNLSSERGCDLSKIIYIYCCFVKIWYGTLIDYFVIK